LNKKVEELREVRLAFIMTMRMMMMMKRMRMMMMMKRMRMMMTAMMMMKLTFAALARRLQVRERATDRHKVLR